MLSYLLSICGTLYLHPGLEWADPSVQMKGTFSKILKLVIEEGSRAQHGNLQELHPEPSGQLQAQPSATFSVVIATPSSSEALREIPDSPVPLRAQENQNHLHTSPAG